MLLPSDVARLVLGYLQQEKLPSTCRAFIAESPNLKEYAEQHTDDGAIPGCLLSLFGKSLTTILNEYITMKAKENEAEIPYMMSSLWKKLDLTLSQIRCMQDSAAFQVHQRVRTRKGIDDRMRQKLLSPSVPASPVLHPVIHQTSTPVLATQYILQPINTSVASQSFSSMLCNGQSTMQSNNPVSSIVSSTQTVSVASTQRKQTTTTTTATSSPMRRKQDNQRRRRIPATSSSSTAAERDAELDADTMQGLINDGFPQLVIENAREKILSNKSLQEKLAENINKILASDSAAQTSKQGDGVSVEQDTSIDEILGLQGGEIHMSEEAINDILVQTELDPDFQELYDLFACVSTKTPKTPYRDPPPQSAEAKGSGSEKSKKQDSVEEGSSKQPIENKTDCPKEKEATSTLIEPSSLDTSSTRKDSNLNPQEICVNETTITSGMQRPKSDKVSPDLIISIDSPESDNLVDDGKETHETVLEISSSQPMDVEMEIISSADDGGEDCCFIVEDVLPGVPVSKNSGKSVNLCPEDSEHEEPTVVIINEETTNEKSIDTSQERTENLGTIQSPPPTPQSDVMVVPCTSPIMNSSSEQNERDSQHMESSIASPFSKPQKDNSDATKKQNNDTEPETSEKDSVSQAASTVNVDLAAHETVVFSTDIAVPDGSQGTVDASSIVTLNIITEDLPEESEISSAVKSLSEDTFTTIILSPLVKSQELRLGPAQGGSSGDDVESSVTGEKSQFLATSSDAVMNSVNVPNGDCTVYAVSGTSSADGSVIQLMPTSGSTFAPSGNLFISAANGAPAKPPSIMMLSNGSAVSNGQKQSSLFQTPPRPGSVYTVGQAISPKLSQGSTIILASPVQPMLQGVMGMFPVSLVGQSSGTFSAQPHQILQVPISKPLVPKLPLPPKFQKPPSKLAATTGKSSSNLSTDSTNRSAASMPRECNGKNPTSETQQKPDDRSLLKTANLASKSGEAHRRVLCFDGSSRTSVSPSSSKGQKNKNDPIKTTEAPSEVRSAETSVSKETGTTESSTSLENNSKGDVIVPTKDQLEEKRSTSSSGGSPGNKENVLQKGTERHETGQTDKKTTSQENVRVEKSGKQPQETVKRQTPLPNILRRTPQKISSERVCSTSPLAKQASQLLQNMQFQSPTTKPRSVGDLPLPRTPGSGMEEKVMDNHSDHLRTPVSRLYNEDGGMLKPMMPPTTPDLPTCSPASEAGSENSVNMAAHTLMILSQASMTKSSSHTPLKDNTQQSRTSKSSSKKRRLEETKDYEKRPHKQELLSPSSSQRKKKMKKQRRKSSDNFPTGMDVEKFLMSLHYDE